MGYMSILRMPNVNTIEFLQGLWRTVGKVNRMEYKPSKGFIEDIVKLACLCDENDTDNLEIGCTMKDGRRAIVEMTFRTEDGNGNE